MKHKKEHINIIALIYLLIPLILFILGWLKAWIAAPLVFLLCFSIVKSWLTNKDRFTYLCTPLSWKNLIPTAIMFLVVIFMTGMTGNWVQHTDYFVRNDIFYDLTFKDWPPALNDNRYFIYYFQSWLPAAFVGSHTNWEIAQWTYFAWSLLGMALVLYYIYKSLNSSSFWVAFTLLAWGGLELIPCSLVAPWTHGLTISQAFGWNNHVAEPLVTFYPSFSIKSIIHCFIPIALICGMLMQRDIVKEYAPLLAICALMYSPMGAIFLLPIVIYLYIREHFSGEQLTNSYIWKQFIKNTFSLHNVSMYLILILLIFPFYAIAESLGGAGLAKITSFKFFISFSVYFFFNTLILTWIIRRNDKDNLLWVLVCVQFCCLMAAAIYNTDMAMKGTIVSQFFFFILFCRSFRNAPQKHKIYYILYLVGSATYFIHMKGALIALIIGLTIYGVLKLKPSYIAILIMSAGVFLTTAIILYPQCFVNTYSKLSGQQTKYNRNIGIYQPDGGSGKWWWYKSFPDRSKLPSWFK